MHYKFSTLDPRGTKQADAHNASVTQNSIGMQIPVLGIEVTIPQLAELCTLGNLDHHNTSASDLCAIELAMDWTPLPIDGVTTLVTVRPDPDAIGAMAILSLRRRVVEEIGDRLEDRRLHERGILAPVYDDPTGPDGKAIRERVNKIAKDDKAARGPWPGPQPLEARWPALPAGSIILTTLNGDEAPEMAALGAMCSDHKATLEDRVWMMMTWLRQGTIPDTYISRAAAERQEMVQAIASGQIKATTFGGVAVVHSTHRAATEVGYRLAPVVLAVNRAFRFQGGEPHLKYTICQYREGHVDLRAVLAELQAREPGWGGTGSIIGSPQGISSMLSVEEILGDIRLYTS